MTKTLLLDPPMLDILFFALACLPWMYLDSVQAKDKVHSACSSDHTPWMTGNVDLQMALLCGLAIYNPPIYLQINPMKNFS